MPLRIYGIYISIGRFKVLHDLSKSAGFKVPLNIPAALSAPADRYCSGPPLRFTSRLIVEGDLPKSCAIERRDCPVARPREISSRSDKVRASIDRDHSGGLMPPLSDKIRWIDE